MRRLCASAVLAALAGGSPAWAQPVKASESDQPVSVEADDIQGQPDQSVTATGNVVLEQGGLRVEADQLSYDQPADMARAKGRVKLSSEGNWFSGPEVQLAVERFEGFFSEPTYFIAKTRAGGQAARWEFKGRNHAVAHAATYTSCDRDDPAWWLSADRVELDFEKNEGTADGAVLRFYGVPILAAPSFTFPLSDDRKSGWLPPAPTIDSKAGFQLAVPYYWNIAPNRDLTLTPVVSAKRGAGLEAEFRYLQPSYEGQWMAHTLPHDAITKHSRGALRIVHEGALPGDALYEIDGLRVSDNEYWKDFSRGLTSITPRLLAADFRVSRPFDHWTPYARIKRWQVLQDVTETDPLQAPYDRLPQLGVRATQPLFGGFQFGLETEFNRFVNPHGYIEPVTAPGTSPRPTGSRTHLLGSLSWPHITPGWSFVPKLSMNAAAYDLDARPLVNNGEPQHLSRAIPTLSVDSAWTLERDADWFGRAVRQTLEPRLLYVKTTFRDQSAMPNFDSAVRDFNVDSIYTENAFSGVDRVSDSHQLTAGVTTRVLDPVTGREELRLGLAQRLLFEDQQVTPPGEQPITQSLSDVLLFGSSNLSSRWYLDAAIQYSYNLRETVRSVVSARYTTKDYRTVSLAYRYKANETKQVDLGWQWPLYGGGRKVAADAAGDCVGALYAAGRVNYSLLERRVTESVAAFEYDSGCWVGRVLARRQSTSTREATTQLGFEIEFVGLSRLGTNRPARILKDNIPGYRPLRDDTDAPAAP